MAVDFNEYSIETLRSLKNIKDKISMRKTNIAQILQEIRDNYDSMNELKEILSNSEKEYNEISAKGAENITASEEARQSAILDEGIELKDKISKLEDVILNLSLKKEAEEKELKILEEEKENINSNKITNDETEKTDFYNGNITIERDINAVFEGNHKNNFVAEVNSHREINSLRRSFFIAPKESIEVSPELKSIINDREDIIFIDIKDGSREKYLNELKRKRTLEEIEKEIQNIASTSKEEEVSLKSSLGEEKEVKEEVTEITPEVTEETPVVTEEASEPVIDEPKLDDTVEITKEQEIDINNEETKEEAPSPVNLDVPYIPERNIEPIKDENVVPTINAIEEPKVEETSTITPLEVTTETPVVNNIFENINNEENIPVVNEESNKIATAPKEESFTLEANFMKNKVASTTMEKKGNIITNLSEPNNKLIAKVDENNKIVDLSNSEGQINKVEQEETVAPVAESANIFAAAQTNMSKNENNPIKLSA